ncbi:MAG: ATP synthase F1 subunit delta [Myxococcales bacterium]|nr:ATP synthase F1 subunit delta [Myxococcales bacterium]USN51726.1 MAG: ATP synthase F1 subunit delta [Myxococcales bacterium]
MMYQQVIARRYAKGLLLSLNTDELDDVLSELKSFIDLIKTSAELKRVFEDPSFSPLERRAVIDKIASQAKMHKNLHHFLLLVIDKNRIALIALMYEALVTLIDSQKARIRVKIISALPASQEEIREITDTLGASLKKTILVDSYVDPSLLGGMRIEVAGTIFDGSLKAKLMAIGHELRI